MTCGLHVALMIEYMGLSHYAYKLPTTATDWALLVSCFQLVFILSILNMFFILSFLEHRRCLITWLVSLSSRERRFHGRESNCQPLCLVWVPFHNNPVV